MGKGLKLAVVVEMAVLAAAGSLLLLFLVRGVGRDQPLAYLSFLLAGVLLAGLLFGLLLRRTLQRERMVRRFYVSQDWIYNSEIGYAPMARIVEHDDPFGFVTFAADSLARMSYGFEVAEAPQSFAPSLVIDSAVFLYHELEEDGGIVVDEWRGLLSRIDNAAGRKEELVDIAEFDNASELARLLENSGVFEASETQEGEA